jgi:ABC-type nitrate/sulfonate/bicarbonate transport system ATPase subunit
MYGTIKVSGLTFGYDRQRIFENFKFVTDSRITVLIGPSGCGKTTLLKVISGLLVGSAPVTIEKPAPAFLVLQSDSLAPWLSGQQNIELFSKDLWGRVNQSPLFSLIGPFIDRPAYALSFGQRRSIELTCALVSGYPLLLLDEPLNFLDRVRRRIFLDYLSNVTTRSDTRVLMTTHYNEQDVAAGLVTFEFKGDPPFSSLSRLET